jgi:hypothetical protein
LLIDSFVTVRCPASSPQSQCTSTFDEPDAFGAEDEEVLDAVGADEAGVGKVDAAAAEAVARDLTVDRGALVVDAAVDGVLRARADGGAAAFWLSGKEPNRSKRMASSVPNAMEAVDERLNL